GRRALLYWRQLRGKMLVRLECFPGQVGVKMTQLSRVADITFASRPGIHRELQHSPARRAARPNAYGARHKLLPHGGTLALPRQLLSARTLAPGAGLFFQVRREFLAKAAPQHSARGYAPRRSLGAHRDAAA